MFRADAWKPWVAGRIPRFTERRKKPRDHLPDPATERPSGSGGLGWARTCRACGETRSVRAAGNLGRTCQGGQAPRLPRALR